MTEKDAKRIETLKNAINTSVHKHDFTRPVITKALASSLALYSLDEWEACLLVEATKDWLSI